MCKESTQQIEELLKGETPNIMTKGLKFLALNQDRNFKSLENKIDLLINKFEGIETEIDTRIKETEGKIKQVEESQHQFCMGHREELTLKFAEIDKNEEVLNFLGKHPLILKIIGVACFIIIIYILGRIDLLDLLFKNI